MKLINKILVYIDDSEKSLAACQYAILLAKQLKAKLVVIAVINTKALQDLLKAKIFISREHEEYAHDMKEDADRYLKWASKTAALKELEIETVLKEGVPSVEIKHWIEEHSPDLFIVGSEDHSLKSLREELVSEKEQAARIAKCNVLLIKDIDRIESLFNASNII